MTKCMDLEDIMLREISQTEKDKYCAISLTHVILKKKKKQPKSCIPRMDWWSLEAGAVAVGENYKRGQEGKKKKLWFKKSFTTCSL